MITPYNGFGLSSGRQFISKINGKWTLDAIACENYTWQISYDGCDIWRDLPWSVWGVSNIEDVFCAFGITGGQFDLSKWNQEWFDVTKQKIIIRNLKGIRHHQELTCANELNGDESAYSPWVHNIQGIKSFYEAAADVYLKAFIEKCIVEFAGLDVVYGQGNECNDWRMVRVCKDVINPTLKAHGLVPFSYAGTFKPFFPFKYDAPAREIVQRFGLTGKDLMRDCRTVRDTPAWFNTLTPDEKEIILTVANSTTASPLHEMKKDVGYLWGAESNIEEIVFKPAHHCSNAEDEQIILMLRYDSDDTNITLSDDGAFDGHSECDWNLGTNGKMYKRPSGDEWKGMVTKVINTKKLGSVIFEHTPEKQDNLDCQAGTVAAISEAIFARTGKYPENWQKYPKPVFECNTGETKTQICGDGSTIVTHTCEGGRWVETGNVCPNPQTCKCIYYLNIHDSWFGIGNFIKCIFGAKEKYCKDRE